MRNHVFVSAVLILASALCSAGEPWPRYAIDSGSRGADGVRLLDIDGDSLPEIATGWEEGGSVRFYHNPGAKAAKQAWPLTIAGSVKSPEDAVLIDLNGDGRSDVVSCCEGKTKTVFFHWAPREGDVAESKLWKTEAVPATEKQQAWMFALPVDLNADGTPELIVGSKGAGASVSILSAKGDSANVANWSLRKLIDAGWIMSLQLHDMDGDGREDVLVSDRKGKRRGVYWLKNPGKIGGEWVRRDIGGSDREVLFLTRGDMNGDGQLDVAVAVKGGPLTWFDEQDLATDRWSIHEIPMPENCGGGKGVAIGDINQDGKNDLVFSCESAVKGKSGVRWLQGPANPTTDKWVDHEVSGPAGVKFDRIELLDLDGDGDLDILTCEERDNLGVIWYANPQRSR